MPGCSVGRPGPQPQAPPQPLGSDPAGARLRARGACGGAGTSAAEERGPRGRPGRALLGTQSRAAVVARAERGAIAGSPPPADLSARYALILPGDSRPPGPQKAWLPPPVHGRAASHSGEGAESSRCPGFPGLPRGRRVLVRTVGPERRSVSLPLAVVDAG